MYADRAEKGIRKDTDYENRVVVPLNKYSCVCKRDYWQTQFTYHLC